VLFPDGLNSKAGITEADVTKSFKATKAKCTGYNPMKIQHMSDVDIYKAVSALFPTLDQTHAKMNLNRRHGNSSIRALIITSAPYNLQSANWPRNWTLYFAWAIVEFTSVKQYRQDLFDGPAGGLLLTKLFDCYAIPATQTNIGSGGLLVQDKKFAWCDQVSIRNAPSVLEQTHDIDSTTNISQHEAIQVMQSDIQQLIKTWENSPHACNNNMPPGSIDAKVASLLSNLVRVCHSFILPFLTSLFLFLGHRD
jgi:hypothetical protein